jgi:hypothetical protein
MFFGVCHVKHSCHGLMMLSNATNVTAKWTVRAVANGGRNKSATAIVVKGFEHDELEEDDPSVFVFSPTSGMLEGPCASVTAAMAAQPNDLLRR